MHDRIGAVQPHWHMKVNFAPMDTVSSESSSRIRTPKEAVADLVGLPERLRFARGFYGWTQSQLAKESGVDQGTISRLEKGTAPDVRVTTLISLSAALRVTLDWLAMGRGPAFPSGGTPTVVADSPAKVARIRRQLPPKSKP